MGRNKLPVGQRKDVRVNLRIGRELKRKLDAIAKKRDVALVDVTREALREYADKAVA